MSAAYSEHFARHLRLVVLRLLAEVPDYKLNASILRDMAEMHGLVASRDRLAGELAWLAEQGLITIAELASGLIVATLSARGLDVAEGRVTVPGVQRPAPKG